MLNAFIIHEKDDVVTVTEAIPRGGIVSFDLESGTVAIAAATDIPKYHKMAIHSICKADPVYKYGEIIGHATRDILIGEHVHTQNLED